MAIKTLRVFAEYTSTGFVPMPTAGGIDYGYTLANTFPSTTPSSFQTDDPDIDVTVTAMTDFYVWIRISGTAWNPSYTRNVRVYPDSPDINNVVMNMIIATGPAGTSAYSQIVQTSNRLYFNGATTDSVYNSKFAGKTYINELNFGTAPQLATVATSGAYADLTGKPALSTVATSGSYADLSNKPSGTAPISYNSGTNSFQISVASASTNGYLTSTDWSTFNAKYLLPAGGTTAQYLRGDGTLATFPTTLDSTRLIFTGRNSTGSTLTKGTVVYINGVSGNTALLAKAIASGDSTSAQTLGVIENDIANNATGTVVLVGAVGNLDTSSFTEGVQLYLSGTVAGAFTSSKVLAPTHIVYVGIVTRAHPTLGTIEVKIQNGYELDEIHDVQISSPANKDILYHDTASSLWKHASIASVLGYTPYNATNPNNYIALTALSASAPLSYNNTTGAFSITQANTSTNGFLSSTDWNTFNSKQNALTLGNVSEVSSNVLMFPDGGTGKTIGNLTIQVVQSSASTNGYLSSTDWTTFNNKQNALTNPVTGTGATNTLPKWTSSSALGNSNITDSGSLITLGSNTTISSGGLGIGTTALTGINLRVSSNITGATSAIAIQANGIVQSDVTGNVRYFSSNVSTAVASFTVANLNHFETNQSTFGAGSTVSNQSGFVASSSLIGGTNNYGFRGQIPSGTNRWNIYMDGTANNYMAGSLGIGATALTGTNLTLGKSITGAVSSYGILQQGIVQADVTTQSFGLYNLAQIASGVTLPLYVHYATDASAFSGTVTTQVGFRAGSSLTGATNNYGFQGTIAAGTNRWNLFMNGTANNYLGGNLGIGITAPTSALHIDRGTATASYLQFTAGTTTGQLVTDGFDIGIDASGNGIINQQENLPLMMFTNNTERMRITSAGNVGIGTSSPTVFGGGMEIQRSAQAALRVSTTTGTLVGGAEFGYEGSQGAYIQTVQANGQLSIYTGNANVLAMRFTSGGNVGINTTTPGGKLQVSGGDRGTSIRIESSSNASLAMFNSTSQREYQLFSQGNGDLSIYDETAGAYRFKIKSSGNVLIDTTTDNGEKLYVNGSIRATGNITANSDLVLKKNLKLVDNPIDKLNSLNGYLYQLKEDDSYQYGVVAQEVEKVLPHAVQTGITGIKGVAYNQLTPLLIEGFKVHETELQALKKRVAYLENKLG